MTDSTDTRRTAGWLPSQQDALERWIEGHRDRVGSSSEPLHSVVQRFADEMTADPLLRMAATRMIDQVPHGRRYRERHIADVDEFLRLVSGVLTVAPEYGETMVMLPLAGILDWTMSTPVGYAFYRQPQVNAWLHDLLDVWSGFLSGPDSRYVLNDSDTGWLSPAARDAVGLEQFEHDPDQPYAGFTSWNDYFSRRLREGVRPIASPDDDAVIANACESTPYRIEFDVQERSRFWIKEQPYSLSDMLADDESVAGFVGGTVYQAFLSATDYHRWHSPVSGTVLRAFTIGGTYYSEADAEGSDADTAPDSQAYLAHVSARAVIVVQADEPSLGTVAFVAVGMLEVSSCVLDPGVAAGQHVTKGDEIGYFQYGGSTHCLIFEAGAISHFAAAAIPQAVGPSTPLLKVRTALALANRSRDTSVRT